MNGSSLTRAATTVEGSSGMLFLAVNVFTCRVSLSILWGFCSLLACPTHPQIDCGSLMYHKGSSKSHHLHGALNDWYPQVDVIIPDDENGNIILEDDIDDTEKTVLLETKGVIYLEDEEVTVECVASNGRLKARTQVWKQQCPYAEELRHLRNHGKGGGKGMKGMKGDGGAPGGVPAGSK